LPFYSLQFAGKVIDDNMDFQIDLFKIQTPTTLARGSRFFPSSRSGFPHLGKEQRKLIAGVFVVLIIGIVLIYFFGGSSFSESRVELKVEGPSEITSGNL